MWGREVDGVVESRKWGAGDGRWKVGEVVSGEVGKQGSRGSGEVGEAGRWLGRWESGEELEVRYS